MYQSVYERRYRNYCNAPYLICINYDSCSDCDSMYKDDAVKRWKEFLKGGDSDGG